jgi:hypothetical protein
MPALKTVRSAAADTPATIAAIILTLTPVQQFTMFTSLDAKLLTELLTELAIVAVTQAGMGTDTGSDTGMGPP